MNLHIKSQFIENYIGIFPNATNPTLPITTLMHATHSKSNRLPSALRATREEKRSLISINQRSLEARTYRTRGGAIARVRGNRDMTIAAMLGQDASLVANLDIDDVNEGDFAILSSRIVAALEHREADEC